MEVVQRQTLHNTGMIRHNLSCVMWLPQLKKSHPKWTALAVFTALTDTII